MKTIYFIDSENVGDSWVSLVTASSPYDEILVFYTQNSPHMNYRNIRLLKEASRPVTFIECFEGSNALDFQLSTELGYRMTDIGDDSFVIVSNDTGYDAVVRYWRKNGRAVKRITGKSCAELAAFVQPAAPSIHPVTVLIQTVTPEIAAVSAPAPTPALSPAPATIPLPAPEEKAVAAVDKPQPAPAEAEPLVIDQNAKEILYLIGRKNLVMLHEALQQLYGTKKASAIYNSFKKDTEYNSFLSSHPVWNTEEKQSAYCSIVFSASAAKETMPADFPQFAVEAWAKKKNLNSFRASLQQKYGKEKSEKYYSLFKNHIKILDTIK